MSNNSLNNLSSHERSGFSEEFVRLYVENSRQIYTYIRSVVPLPEDAEDVFQETCVVLWRRFDEYDFNANFYNWARRIAYFQVMSSRKRHACSRLQFSEAVLDVVAQEEEKQNETQEKRRQLLKSCLLKLREKDRQLILKRYGKKQTVKVLAKHIGRPVGAVYKSLARIEYALINCVHGKSLNSGGEKA